MAEDEMMEEAEESSDSEGDGEADHDIGRTFSSFKNNDTEQDA